MSGSGFNPWVGPLYKSEGLSGVRLLVLGETQYSGDASYKEPRRARYSEADETEQNVIDLAINGPVQHRPFWNKVTKLLLNRANGESISKADRADLWNRIAFYNCIQWTMPAGRTKPTRAMWDEAREPFLSVVRKLSPHIILVLGRRMQGNLPPVSCVTVCIPHPASRGFTYGAWCSKIHVTLNATRRRL
jgi:hypothetical protein